MARGNISKFLYCPKQILFSKYAMDKYCVLYFQGHILNNVALIPTLNIYQDLFMVVQGVTFIIYISFDILHFPRLCAVCASNHYYYKITASICGYRLDVKPFVILNIKYIS